MVTKIVNTIISLAIVAWIVIVGMDFYRVSQSQAAQFCFLGEERRDYSDGYTDVCKGLGYNAYTYRRTAITGMEFSPFWQAEKTSSTDVKS